MTGRSFIPLAVRVKMGNGVGGKRRENAALTGERRKLEEATQRYEGLKLAYFSLFNTIERQQKAVKAQVRELTALLVKYEKQPYLVDKADRNVLSQVARQLGRLIPAETESGETRRNA